MSGLGAFRLAPVCLEKVWAAPRLDHPVGKVLAVPPQCGEVWLASDRHHVTQVMLGGPPDGLVGLGLDQVAARWPEELMGPGREGPFPLITKILSVGDWLSVQVHPDDAAAREMEGEPWGKNEAWLVMAAAPGAEIVMGLGQGVDRPAVAAAMDQGRITEVLAKVPARQGDVFHLPAGMLHATGPGLTIFEVQQASDVTYRFYDWDRPGLDGRLRELHQDKALAALKPTGPGQPAQPRPLGPGAWLMVDDPHFALLAVSTAQAYRPFHGGRRLRLVMVLAGGGEIKAAGRTNRLGPGQSWCLPYDLEGAEIIPSPGGVSLVEAVALD